MSETRVVFWVPTCAFFLTTAWALFGASAAAISFLAVLVGMAAMR